VGSGIAPPMVTAPTDPPRSEEPSPSPPDPGTAEKPGE
jgi:hypothetical protein